MSNLLQRVIVAIIAIPLTIFIVMTKPLGLYVLILILTALAAHEYFGFAKAKGYLPHVELGILFSVLIAATFGMMRFRVTLDSLGLPLGEINFEPLAILLLLFIVLALVIEIIRGYSNPIENVAVTVFGAIYPGVCIGSIFGIYEHFYNRYAIGDSFDTFHPGLFIIVLLGSIWLCDSAAYFAGKAFGKHKLIERVSPNKTWEGSIAGFIVCVVAWIAAPSIFYKLTVIPTIHFIIFGVICGSVSQFGDLAESLLKRDAKVKDSSNLIPGHGGILDRLDSLMFTAPILFAYVKVIEL